MPEASIAARGKPSSTTVGIRGEAILASGGETQEEGQAGGWLAVLLGTLIFSTGGIIIRHIELPPATTAFSIQIVTTAIVLIWQRRALAKIPRLLLDDRGSLYRLLAIGVFGAIDRMAFISAVWLAPIAKVLLVAYLYPIWTTLLAHRFLGERMTVRSVLATLTALLGMVILFLPEFGPTAPGHVPGMLLGGVVALVVGGTRILVKGLNRSVTTPVVLLADSLISLILLGPLALVSGPATFSTQNLVMILVGGLALGILARALVVFGVRRVPAGPAATLGYLEPVVAALLAWWLLSEALSEYTLIGGPLILAGSLATVLSRLRNRSRHREEVSSQ